MRVFVVGVVFAFSSVISSAQSGNEAGGQTEPIAAVTAPLRASLSSVPSVSSVVKPSSAQSNQPDTSMPRMSMDDQPPAIAPQLGSGTSWQPAVSPEHEWMIVRDGWDLMAHGVIFLDYNQQGGPRGGGAKAESVNYEMLMERRQFGTGTILLRQMFSAESLTSPHPGFPELFQTGETYHGKALVDHQHPHNVFSTLDFLYTLPLTEKLTWQIYGGPAAEPALGPVVYIHRASAAELPIAPLGHHLQDSTHISFGVITTGIVIDRLHLEASAFNGREPNEERWSIQFAALDSWSGRASIAPANNWTAQYSIGRLEHPEALEPGSQWRETASVEYAHPLQRGNWATSLVWGRVHKIATNTTLNSYLLESSLNFLDRNYAFMRLELVDKDELFPEAALHPAYRIGAYTFGSTRDLVQHHRWQLGLGADVTFYSMPGVLNAAYGTRPVSFQVFLRVRPGIATMTHHH